jgi:hypothetical protein
MASRSFEHGLRCKRDGLCAISHEAFLADLDRNLAGEEAPDGAKVGRLEDAAVGDEAGD